MLVMRALVIAAATVALSTAAFAGEGNGDPFPGPNAVMRETIQNPKYTMGGDAPFNYFYTPKPTSMAGYHASAGSSQDPFPFKANGQTIQLRPPASGYGSFPATTNHG